LLNFFNSLLKVVTAYILNRLIALYFICMKIVCLIGSLIFINLSVLNHKNVIFWLSFDYITFNLFEAIDVKYIILYLGIRRLSVIFTSLLNDRAILSFRR